VSKEPPVSEVVMNSRSHPECGGGVAGDKPAMKTTATGPGAGRTRL